MMRFVTVALLLCSCATTDLEPRELELPLDPVAVARDPDSGRMLVADRRTPIHSFSPTAESGEPVHVHSIRAPDGADSETGGLAFAGTHLWIGRGGGLLRLERTTAKDVKFSRVFEVDGAQRLGPVASDGEGHVFVADTRAMRLYRVDGEAVELFARGLRGVTGLGHDGASLWVTDNEGVIGRWTEVGLADRVVLPGGLGALGSPVFTPEGRMFVPSRQAKALIEVFPLKRPGIRTDSGEVTQAVPQRFRIVVPNVEGIGQPAYDPVTESLWVPSETNRSVRIVPLSWIDRR